MVLMASVPSAPDARPWRPVRPLIHGDTSWNELQDDVSEPLRDPPSAKLSTLFRPGLVDQPGRS